MAAAAVPSEVNKAGSDGLLVVNHGSWKEPAHTCFQNKKFSIKTWITLVPFKNQKVLGIMCWKEGRQALGSPAAALHQHPAPSTWHWTVMRPTWPSRCYPHDFPETCPRNLTAESGVTYPQARVGREPGLTPGAASPSLAPGGWWGQHTEHRPRVPERRAG